MHPRLFVLGNMNSAEPCESAGAGLSQVSRVETGNSPWHLVKDKIWIING